MPCAQLTAPATRLAEPPRPPGRAAGPELRLDLAAVAANTRLLAARATRLMAVVKADGFGHGAVETARAALGAGASSLGVTSVEEAMSLRHAGLRAPILSWLNPVDAAFDEALRADVSVAVPGREHLAAVVRAASRTGRTAKVHLHLDTGMARDGADPAQWGDLCRQAREAERGGLVRVTGVMGHLGCADTPGDACTDRALELFRTASAVAVRAGLRPGVRHLAATSATLTDPRTRFDLSRVGAGLYGIDPTRTTRLRPALTLTAPVVSARTVPAGTRAGYGHTWTAARRTHLALLAVGYADGLPRAASGRAEVLLAGRRRPVVGRVSMDQVIVDCGDRPAAPGDIATVFGTGDAGEPTVQDWARWSGTIEHEIVTGLGTRLRRTVHDSGVAA
ncbi:alanine racemase [Actinacidiphila glaucinigra]|uniref:alanine racemase n=1 Tax=Actinacidiphila glaucinigra TaxID=235986 RepID=UPI00371FAEF3